MLLPQCYYNPLKESFLSNDTVDGATTSIDNSTSPPVPQNGNFFKNIFSIKYVKLTINLITKIVIFVKIKSNSK